jgi:hypothetical protein
MSDKAREGSNKMSVEYVREAKGMADFILHKVHRGPGDTIDAAMHRAEQMYGAPASWLHRLRYRDVKDMPVSAFGALFNAYRAAADAGDKAYARERALADARNSKMARLADLVAGAKDEGALIAPELRDE